MSNNIKPIFQATGHDGIFRSAWGWHVGTVDGRHIGHIPRESLDEAIRFRDNQELARLIFAFRTESLALDQLNAQLTQLSDQIGVQHG